MPPCIIPKGRGWRALAQYLLYEIPRTLEGKRKYKMKSREYIREYIDALKTQGVSPYSAAPPFYRILWRLRINITPPLNQTPVWYGMLHGLAFGAFVGMYYHFTGLRITLLWLLLLVFIEGLFFGAIAARINKKKAKNLTLPDWD